MTHQDGLTPSGAERIRIATATLAEAETADLTRASNASLIMLISRLRGSLSDVLHLLPPQDPEGH